MAFYENLVIEKGMYGAKGKNLTQVLEGLDPSINYKNSSLEGMDAFERQLKRFDIKVSGGNSDCVEKFFQTSSSSALFPEYVSRAVKQGIEYANVLPEITATTTKIDSMDYRSIVSNASVDDKELKIVAEGAFIPQTVIKTQENLVSLHKHGRMLVSSYEALRFQRLDLFTVALRQIGSYIARSQLEQAIKVLINGDGNNNPAGTVSKIGEDLSYADLLNLWGSLSPYELNTFIASTSVVKKILSLPEMKDSTAGLNFQSSGKLVTPMGATLIHVPNMSVDTIIALDKNCALEMVQAGDVITDYDKLIDRQLERASITCISGFAKIIEDASKILN